MLLVDSNVWLAALLDKHEFHSAVVRWMDQQAAGSIYFCRATQQSMLRLLCTTAVMAPFGRTPLTNNAAWSLYEELQNDDRISWADEPIDLTAQWKRLGAVKGASPKLWMDAYLAAFAIVGGYEIVTIDNAFKQFKNLNVRLISADDNL